jgi:hypothetical protein
LSVPYSRNLSSTPPYSTAATLDCSSEQHLLSWLPAFPLFRGVAATSFQPCTQLSSVSKLTIDSSSTSSNQQLQPSRGSLSPKCTHYRLVVVNKQQDIDAAAAAAAR